MNFFSMITPSILMSYPNLLDLSLICLKASSYHLLNVAQVGWNQKRKANLAALILPICRHRECRTFQKLLQVLDCFSACPPLFSDLEPQLDSTHCHLVFHRPAVHYAVATYSSSLLHLPVYLIAHRLARPKATGFYQKPTIDSEKYLHQMGSLSSFCPYSRQQSNFSSKGQYGIEQTRSEPKKKQSKMRILPRFRAMVITVRLRRL